MVHIWSHSCFLQELYLQLQQFMISVMECAFYVIVFYMICVTGAYLAAYRFYKKQQEEKEAEVTIDKSEDWEKYQESADF